MTCLQVNGGITDLGTGKVECGVAFGCCLCRSITCGTPDTPCDGLFAGGRQSAYGVERIVILGEAGAAGAVIDCGGTQSCALTFFTGSWIDTIKCGGDSACVAAHFDVDHTNGLICGKKSCQDATFRLSDNREGDVWCNSPESCGRAHIEIGNIGEVTCNGDDSCNAALITVIDPREGFQLRCNGQGACSELTMKVIISSPSGGCERGSADLAPLKFKGITCSSGEACKGMTFVLENNGCAPVMMENLECEPEKSCSGAHFDFDAGSGGVVNIQNCKCGASCAEASGIDRCFDNLRILDCLGARHCRNNYQSVTAPSNGFLVLCSSMESCSGFNLNVVVAGGSQNVIRTLSGFHCGGRKSCQGAAFSVTNWQRDGRGEVVVIEIDAILCIAEGACEGTTFVLGESVNVQRMECIGKRACNGCLVRMGGEGISNVAIPCETLVATEAPRSIEENALPIPVVTTQEPFFKAMSPP